MNKIKVRLIYNPIYQTRQFVEIALSGNGDRCKNYFLRPNFLIKVL